MKALRAGADHFGYAPATPPLPAPRSGERVVFESTYNLTTFGFGPYYKFPPRVPKDQPAFGPAYKADPRNPRLRHGRHADGRGI